MRITFRQPAEVAEERIAIVGDFNGWDSTTHEMKLDVKKGVWSRTISFKPGSTYEFRYLLDGREWKNEEDADGLVGNDFLSHNSVLDL